MSHSRRDFLKTTSAAAAGLVVAQIPDGLLATPLIEIENRPVMSIGDPLIREFAMRGLEAAKAAGASYADVRINSGKARRTDMFDKQVQLIRLTTELQLGVRVLVDGAWGFATSREVSGDEVVRVAQLAVKQAKANPYGRKRKLDLAACPAVPEGSWETPIDQDPWKKTIDDQLNVQLQASEAVFALNHKSMNVSSRFIFSTTDKAFASTDGSYIVQKIHGFGGFFFISGVSEDREFFAQRQPDSFQTGGYGWEVLDRPQFIQDAAKAAEEVIAMTKGKPVDPGRYDIVVDGYAMKVPLATSIGRALQIDRVYGYEMNGGGTSYLTPPEKTLGQYSFKNAKLNVRGSRSVPKSGSTVKWDDEGVAPDDFQLIKDGVVVDYMTSREFAAKLGWWYNQQKQSVRSHGCAAAEGPHQTQLIADPTLIMEPASRDASVEELIDGVKQGIYFTRGGFGSIDPALMNGEYYGSGPVYEIKNGKLGGILQYAAYQVRTPDLWKSMDAIGGKSTQILSGFTVAKGDPFQIIGRDAVCPAGRFRQINVVNTGRKG
jgi:TldD protein